jgi:thiol-disulfide isomerase/thioredoxin
MSKKRPLGTRQPQQSLRTQAARWWRPAIIGGVVLLVAMVLVVKNWAVSPSAATDGGAKATATLPEAVGQTQATAVLPQGESPASATPLPAELPEAQLERLLAAGQPTLAFFHSTNCVQCLKMMQVVEEVYPEFSDQVALVDINVYEPSNASLLQRARIQAIPTQVFFDSTGRGLVVMGAMDPQQFRERMQAVAGAQ